ncbi:MAG TPA: cyclic nucleotide-binding domain-containing protein [Dehalococcoidia bacterium]|jgi:CRP/FNR family cyclic AMP-dependent transcriptional regulator|nr:cyclic nucleotide-binding domain-containing protein [Dehalococcoidia bacterium]
MAHEEALAAAPLFSQLSRKDLTRLGRAVVQRKYKKGETIVKEGEQAVAFFIIVSGRVEVVQKAGSRSQKLNELGPGDCFGEMALLDGGLRVATIRALEDTECLVLSRWDFVAELRTNPHIAVGMLPIISKRLRDVEAKLAKATSTH